MRNTEATRKHPREDPWLALKTFENRLVSDPLCFSETVEESLDRGLQLPRGAIAHFALIPLAKSTMRDAARDLVDVADIGVPADKIKEKRQDLCMLADRFGRILLGQCLRKVVGAVLELRAQRCLGVFKMS